MEVKYVKYGVANRFEKHIELHEGLKEFPELHDHILAHELKHTSPEERMGAKDFILDFYADKGASNFMMQYLKFLLKTPSAWRQFLPYYPTPHGWYMDMNKLLITILLLISVGFGGLALSTLF